jgi:large subunit ribosomal protein L38e
MPKEIKDLKEFIKIMRREKKHLPKAEKITIKKNKKNSVTKFKLRTPKFLYTLMVNDITRAEKIMQSIPPNLKKEQPNQKTSA